MLDPVDEDPKIDPLPPEEPKMDEDVVVTADFVVAAVVVGVDAANIPDDGVVVAVGFVAVELPKTDGEAVVDAPNIDPLVVEVVVGVLVVAVLLVPNEKADDVEDPKMDPVLLADVVFVVSDANVELPNAGFEVLPNTEADDVAAELVKTFAAVVTVGVETEVFPNELEVVVVAFTVEAVDVVVVVVVDDENIDCVEAGVDDPNNDVAAAGLGVVDPNKDVAAAGLGVVDPNKDVAAAGLGVVLTGVFATLAIVVLTGVIDTLPIIDGTVVEGFDSAGFVGVDGNNEAVVVKFDEVLVAVLVKFKPPKAGVDDCSIGVDVPKPKFKPGEAVTSDFLLLSAVFVAAEPKKLLRVSDFALLKLANVDEVVVVAKFPKLDAVVVEPKPPKLDTVEAMRLPNVDEATVVVAGF